MVECLLSYCPWVCLNRFIFHLSCFNRPLQPERNYVVPELKANLVPAERKVLCLISGSFFSSQVWKQQKATTNLKTVPYHYWGTKSNKTMSLIGNTWQSSWNDQMIDDSWSSLIFDMSSRDGTLSIFGHPNNELSNETQLVIWTYLNTWTWPNDALGLLFPHKLQEIWGCLYKKNKRQVAGRLGPIFAGWLSAEGHCGHGLTGWVL